MNKYIIGVGITVAILAVYIVMTDKNILSEQMDTISVVKKVPIVNHISSIKYEKSGMKKESEKNVVAIDPLKKKRIRQKRRGAQHVLYETKDRSGTFTIKLIDPQFNESVSVNQVTFGGKIDGHPFNIRVPENVRDHDLKLQIYNARSKTTKRIDIPFVTDLAQENNNRIGIEIDSSDMENYRVEKIDMTEIPFP